MGLLCELESERVWPLKKLVLGWLLLLKFSYLLELLLRLIDGGSALNLHKSYPVYYPKFAGQESEVADPEYELADGYSDSPKDRKVAETSVYLGPDSFFCPPRFILFRNHWLLEISSRTRSSSSLSTTYGVVAKRDRTPW